jgi:ABC-type dipeptide/oligopeptide/nickel transport system ATPase component
MKKLKVENLTTQFVQESVTIPILDNINFELYAGEIIGIIGESGSGKTQTAMAILNLLPKNIKKQNGGIYFDDLQLDKVPEKEMRGVRGKNIAIIPQESLSVLNPLLTVGYQISETVVSHKKANKKDSKDLTTKLLQDVGFDNPDEIFKKYPHELSGGMRQRILIAIAISCEPEIIIADEPTSSLDIVSELEIINLLKKIKERNNTSIIFITHNINLTKGFCDRIIVMNNSRIVETGKTHEIINNPKHEYTKELIANI